MGDRIDRESSRRLKLRTGLLAFAAATALGIAGCEQAPTAASAPPETATADAGESSNAPEEEFGEFLARPEELVAVPVNEILKSLRLNGIAMRRGRVVYDNNCAGCHGADLRGAPGQNAPDLTDNEWRFSGDDLDSGGGTYFPSDVEWTVRYGVRSGHPNTRGLEADMLAYDPQFRNEQDKANYGSDRFLNDDEIQDVLEYTLQLGGQQFDAAKAARGAVLFQDNAKGNCFDCHGEDGTGILAFGSSNLTRPDLYLYGTDRAAILESIVRGRHGVMPAFDGMLSTEEIKAVSIYVFSRARR